VRLHVLFMDSEIALSIQFDSTFVFPVETHRAFQGLAARLLPTMRFRIGVPPGHLHEQNSMKHAQHKLVCSHLMPTLPNISFHQGFPHETFPCLAPRGTSKVL